MNEGTASAVLLSATTAIPVFTGLLPTFSDVRKTVNDPEMVNDVRMGEIAAAGTVVAIGLIAASLTKSSAPLAVSVLAAGGMVALYESALRSYPTERNGKSNVSNTEG